MRVLLLIMMSILLVGCKDKEKENVDQNKEEPKLIDTAESIAEYHYLETVTCDAFKEDIKYFNYNSTKSDGWFVTDDNDAYYFSLLYKFSDETNCAKLDTKFPDVIFTERMEDGFLRLYDEEYNWLVITLEDGKVKLNKLNMTESNFTSSKEERIPFKRARLATLNKNGLLNFQFVPYAYANDLTKIYAIDIYYDGYYTGDFNNDTVLTSYLTDYKEVFTVTDDNEVIMDFYYVTNYAYERGEFRERYTNLELLYRDNMYILTNKYYYRYKVKDPKCYDYLDIECEYGIMIDEELSEIKNDILYRDSIMMLLSNGRIFYS